MLPTVLFLDDEPELTRGVARALRKASFRVVTANSVEDARTVARDVTATLVESFGGSADQGLVNDAVDQRLKGALQ